MIEETSLLRPRGKYKGTGGSASRTRVLAGYCTSDLIGPGSQTRTHPPQGSRGILGSSGHMTKRSQLLHRHISAARSHPAWTWEAIIKRSATNILVLEKGSTIISRKPSRLSMNQMFCSFATNNCPNGGQTIIGCLQCWTPCGTKLYVIKLNLISL